MVFCSWLGYSPFKDRDRNGASPQPPREKGRPAPYSKFVPDGKWPESMPAQLPMLKNFAKKYNLENKACWKQR